MKNIFILGAEKAGTTSLAQWMLDNQLATLLVPGIKEPYIYSRSDFGSFGIPYHSLPTLDASVGYSTNISAIQRMPEHNTDVFFCLRNAFERSWSAFKMYKISSLNSDDNTLLNNRFTFELTNSGESVIDAINKIHELHFPAKSKNWIEGYLTEERNRIMQKNFSSWIEYELKFYITRGTWPFYSIIRNSLYYLQIKNILSKFRTDQINLISVRNLDDPTTRDHIVNKVFNCKKQTSKPNNVFSSSDLSIDEEKPNFEHSKFDFLRSIFKTDLGYFTEEINKAGLSTDYCNINELSTFINPKN